MTLHVFDQKVIPEETVRVAKAAFPKGNVYLQMRDELGVLYQDSQFADLFPTTGQPGLSPGPICPLFPCPSPIRVTLRVAHADGSYSRFMNQLAKTELLILDDWGIQKIAIPQRNDLMEVIEDRHGLKSNLIASQLPIENWHEYIGEATLADAILDRLIHNAHRLPLKGESMRKLLN